MKDAEQFFIISLIIHLLVFMILAYVIIPPVKKPLDFLDSLSVDFVELRPVVREMSGALLMRYVLALWMRRQVLK